MSDWQQIVALALVGLAVAYLLRSLWGRGAGHRKPACGSCQACDQVGGRALGTELPLVDVRSLTASGQEAGHNLEARREWDDSPSR